MKSGRQNVLMVLVIIAYFGFGMTMISLTGCVTTVEKKPKPQIVRQEIQVLTDYSLFLKQGAEFEKQGEDVKAIQRYKVALALNPDDPGLPVKIANLEQGAHRKAVNHFKKGVSFFKRGKIKDARREFLRTLFSDPTNVEAIDYLKNKMNDQVFSSYTVTKEKSIQEIAKKIYGDLKFTFLVGYFNSLEESARLKAGQILSIPSLDKNLLQHVAQKSLPPKKKEVTMAISVSKEDIEVMTSKAMDLLSKWQYEKAREIVDSILEIDKENKDANDLVFLLEDEADSYQKIAQVHFKENNLEQALQELQVTLACDPLRPGIKKDIQDIDHLLKARYSFNDGRYVYAREQVDMSVKSELTREFSLQLIETMNKRAEDHYNTGLQFFDEKNADYAIIEWRKALALNPTHKQAAKMISRAK